MPRRYVSGLPVYGLTARLLHWSMAVLIIFQLAAGLVMVQQWPEGGPMARALSAMKLYDVHKVLGLVLLGLIVIRLIVRIVEGAPEDEPTLPVWQRELSNFVHTWVYFLLIVIPVTGWLGISLFPALTVFGSINIPGLVAPDQKASATVFIIHAYAAFVLIGLIVMHVGAALFHYVVRGDGVMQRMLPGAGRRDV